jgi:hypothetical protein
MQNFKTLAQTLLGEKLIHQMRKQGQLSLITEMCVLRSGELFLEQMWHE